MVLAIVGVTVLLIDRIDDWPDRIYDWPWWIGIGLMSPLGILLLFDDVVHDALFSDAGSGDAGGDFGGDYGGDFGGGGGGGGG